MKTHNISQTFGKTSAIFQNIINNEISELEND